MITIRCKKKNLLSILGYTTMLSSGIVMYLTFLMAYFNNGSITITVNNYNESNLEFILIPVCLIFGIAGLYKLIKGN